MNLAVALALCVPPQDLPIEPVVHGPAIDAVGDLDFDGYGDFLVGAAWDRRGGDAGSATVYSGRTGEVVHRVWGERAGDFFALRAAGVGDVDSDGAADFAVAAPWAAAEDAEDGDAPGGLVRVYSGRSAEVLHEWRGEPGELLGLGLRGAGDVNQDGYRDVLIGAPGAKGGRGAVYVHSGHDGERLHAWYGEDEGDLLGTAIDSLGDTDGDGSSDVAAASWAGGYVRVYSGRNGKTRHELEAKKKGQAGFGWEVRGAGDVDQDGFGDLLVAVPGAEEQAVLVLGGKKGRAELELERPEGTGSGWGLALDGAGDVNADGFDDLIVGDPGPGAWEDVLARPMPTHAAEAGAATPRPGRVWVLSGNGGKVLHELEGVAPDDRFGVCVSGAGDVNSDGFADVLIGSGQGARVHVRVVSGQKGEVLHEVRVGD